MRAPIDMFKPFPKPTPKPFCVPPQSSDLKTKIEFSMKDKDGNGSVNSEEYGPGKMEQDRFRKADKNSDGKLSYDEYKASKSILVPWEPPVIKPPFPHHGHTHGHKLAQASAEVEGAGEEKPSFLKKALPFLALTNPITAPLGVFSLAKKLFS